MGGGYGGVGVCGVRRGGRVAGWVGGGSIRQVLENLAERQAVTGFISGIE